MSSFFGVDFFRIVNEGLVDDWAQVYAKVPFEEEELMEKGALFGVLRIKGGKLVSKGSDIFLWLDEYFNKTKEKGDLRGLVDGLLKVNADLQAAFCWVMIDGESGERVAKSVAMNGGKVVIIRDGQMVVLSETSERIVVGGLKAGDKLGLGVGGMVDRLGSLTDKKGLDEVVTELNKQVEKETERAVAGLLLEVKKKGKEEVISVSKDEGVELERGMGVVDGEVSEVETDGVDETEVVSNKVVGPDGIKKKALSYWLRISKRGGRDRIKVKKEGQKKGKVLWLGVIFLVLFVVSVVGGAVKSKKDKINSSWQGEISSWQKREEESISLVEANPTGARKLLKDVQEEVVAAESVWMGTRYEEEWMEYKAKLKDSWIKVSGERQVEPKLFLGLSLIRSGLSGNKMVDMGDMVGLVDLNLGLMVKINLEDKKGEVVASDKDKKWKTAGGDENREVFLTSEGLSVSDGGGVEFDAAVSDPKEMEVFGNGIYVLDAGAGEVWKFGLVGESISDRRRWLGLGQEIGIGDLVDIDIDGDIWVLGKKGEVVKLRRGNVERFGLEGGPEDLVGDRVAVEADGSRMAILDVLGSRIVVFDKESGEYQHQLIWDGFSKAKDVIYLDDGKMMVLSEDKLYWIE